MKTVLIPSPQYENFPHGYGNGYVGVNSNHPWFGITLDDLDVHVHGGITWAKNHLPQQTPDGLWWIGFDTGHSGDTLQKWSQARCEFEVAYLEKLAQEALDVCRG